MQDFRAVALLRFPGEEIVGDLEWVGADDSDGPILATGAVEVPDGQKVTLDVWHVVSFEPSPRCSTPLSIVGEPVDNTGRWLMRGDGASVDVGFLRGLPNDLIESLTLQWVIEESLAAVAHLAPGLTRLCLVSCKADSPGNM